jgi:hypothetical protein
MKGKRTKVKGKRNDTMKLGKRNMKRGCKPTAKDDKYREKKVKLYDLKPNTVCTRMMTRPVSSQYDNNYKTK